MKVRSCPAITFAADLKLRTIAERAAHSAGLESRQMLEYAISVGLTPEHGKPGPAVHRCKQVLATEKVPSWKLKAFKYYYMPSDK
jgi:hypothetical protein